MKHSVNPDAALVASPHPIRPTRVLWRHGQAARWQVLGLLHPADDWHGLQLRAVGTGLAALPWLDLAPSPQPQTGRPLPNALDSLWPGHWGLLVLAAFGANLASGWQLVWDRLPSRQRAGLAWTLDAQPPGGEEPAWEPPMVDEMARLLRSPGWGTQVWQAGAGASIGGPWQAVAEACRQQLAPLYQLGGAWPKATVHEVGKHWLVKFCRPGDPASAGSLWLEHLASEQAQALGINVVRTELRSVADTPTLWIERFDGPDAAGNFPLVLPFYALATAGDRQTPSWEGLFMRLRDRCTSDDWPAARDELLRRLLLGVGLNVIDDHWRNHELLVPPDAAPQSVRLSPAYDLVPEASTMGHVCALFGQTRLSLAPKAWERQSAVWQLLARQLGLSHEVLRQQVQAVRTQLLDEWPARLERAELDEQYRKQGLAALWVGCGEG